MPYSSPTGLQTFQKQWTQTLSWAHSNGITTQQYMPVYNQDVAHYKQYGYGMSESERLNAIKASAGYDYTTPIPTDSPNPLNIMGNVSNDLQNIFTGLMPQHLIPDIFDMVKGVVEHPTVPFEEAGQMLAAIGDPAAESKLMQKYVLAPNSIWNLVPGLNDLAELYQGKRGITEMVDNPISTMLTALPLGKIFPKTFAATAAGAEFAQKIGMHPEEMAKLNLNQLAWRAAKSIKTKTSGLRHAPDGRVIHRNYTMGELLAHKANTHGMGAEQSEILRGVSIDDQKALEDLAKLASPALKAWTDLSEDEKGRVDAAVRSTQSSGDLLADPSFTVKEKEAMEKIFDWGRNYSDLKAQAGDIVWQRTAYGADKGMEAYNIEDTNRADKVQAALDDTRTANAALEKRQNTYEKMLDKQQAVDVSISGLVDNVKKTQSNVIQYTKAAATVTSSIDSLYNIQNISRLIGIPVDQITSAIRNRIHNLFSDGAVLDQIKQGFDSQDWEQYYQAVKHANHELDELFKSEVFETSKPALALQQLRKDVKTLWHQVKRREQSIRVMQSIETGRNVKGQKITSGIFQYKNSIEKLMEDAKKADIRFVEVSRREFPAVWDNVAREVFEKTLINKYARGAILLDAVASKIPSTMEGYAAKKFLESHPTMSHSKQTVLGAIERLRKTGMDTPNLDKIFEDSRVMTQTIAFYADETFGNASLEWFDNETIEAAKNEARDFIAKLRTEGAHPRLIPNPSVLDPARKGIAQTKIDLTRMPSSRDAFENAFNFTNTTHDIVGGILASSRDLVLRQAVVDSIDRYIAPHLFTKEETALKARQVFGDKLSGSFDENNVLKPESAQAFNQILEKEWNLIPFDPKAYIGPSLTRFVGKGVYFIDKDLAKAFTYATNKLTQEFEKLPYRALDKMTEIFRIAILGFSPRYSLGHILLGGSFMLLLRSYPEDFRFFSDAWHMSKHGGVMPDDVWDHYIEKYGLSKDAQRLRLELNPRRSVGEGAEDINYDWANTVHKVSQGYSMGQIVHQESVFNRFGTKPGEPNYLLHYLTVLPEANFRFVRRVTGMQRTIAFLSGAHKAYKDGYFFEDAVDEDGKTIRVKREMTPEAAVRQGLLSANKVMGDLRSATILDRTVFQRLMPFWGWTKHVLHYVLMYPMDHPFRAMFLTELARQNSEDVSSGLPLRIQLLFFLGKPDKYGNVQAVDARVMNPFRDTANYLHVSGWLSSLTPAFTGPASLVDPNFSYGDNVLYPQLTYNALYGTDQATSGGGTIYNAAEQVVPELSAFDQAFNLSGQYAYLQSQGGSALWNKITQSLNVNFLYTQDVNLRKMAAATEEKRFEQAKYAAITAWQSGDFSALLQYPGTVPDPRNPLYSITPSQLQRLYAEYQHAYPGQPPSGVAEPLPNPAI